MFSLGPPTTPANAREFRQDFVALSQMANEKKINLAEAKYASPLEALGMKKPNGDDAASAAAAAASASADPAPHGINVRTLRRRLAQLRLDAGEIDAIPESVATKKTNKPAPAQSTASSSRLTLDKLRAMASSSQRQTVAHKDNDGAGSSSHGDDLRALEQTIRDRNHQATATLRHAARAASRAASRASSRAPSPRPIHDRRSSGSSSSNNSSAGSTAGSSSRNEGRGRRKRRHDFADSPSKRARKRAPSIASLSSFHSVQERSSEDNDDDLTSDHHPTSDRREEREEHDSQSRARRMKRKGKKQKKKKRTKRTKQRTRRKARPSGSSDSDDSDEHEDEAEYEDGVNFDLDEALNDMKELGIAIPDVIFKKATKMQKMRLLRRIRHKLDERDYVEAHEDLLGFTADMVEDLSKSVGYDAFDNLGEAMDDLIKKRKLRAALQRRHREHAALGPLFTPEASIARLVGKVLLTVVAKNKSKKKLGPAVEALQTASSGANNARPGLTETARREQEAYEARIRRQRERRAWEEEQQRWMHNIRAQQQAQFQQQQAQMQKLKEEMERERGWWAFFREHPEMATDPKYKPVHDQLHAIAGLSAAAPPPPPPAPAAQPTRQDPEPEQAREEKYPQKKGDQQQQQQLEQEEEDKDPMPLQQQQQQQPQQNPQPLVRPRRAMPSSSAQSRTALAAPALVFDKLKKVAGRRNELKQQEQKRSERTRAVEQAVHQMEAVTQGQDLVGNAYREAVSGFK